MDRPLRAGVRCPLRRKGLHRRSAPAPLDDEGDLAGEASVRTQIVGQLFDNEGGDILAHL